MNGVFDGGNSRSEKNIKISTQCPIQDSNYVGEPLLGIYCYMPFSSVFRLNSTSSIGAQVK
jgi:hypothetical protein